MLPYMLLTSGVSMASLSSMAEWAVDRYDADDLTDLAGFTGLSEAECLQRLEDYRVEEMAKAWEAVNPLSPAEIRNFYESTDLYIWELTRWNASSSYDAYKQLLTTIRSEFPPDDFPRVLDYGSGIGTAALEMLEAGYQVTIADVPGKTYEYARWRLRRRGHSFETVCVNQNLPNLVGRYDVLMSFDVLEHVPRPDLVLRRLSARLRPGGVAAIVTAFLASDGFPHHLAENRDLAPVWSMVVSGCGLDQVGPHIYLKTGRLRSLFRAARYAAWVRSGLYLCREPVPELLTRSSW